MKSAAARLFLAFALADALVTAVFLLLSRAAGLTWPPRARLLLAGDAGATVLIFAAVATAAARRFTRPIAALNAQLDALDLAAPRRVGSGASDPALVELEGRVNGLLERAALGLKQVREYAAHVAHELRTPLTVLRLKIEQAAGAMPAQLSEELQAELLRLSRITEQSLLLARAEQGALKPDLALVDLKRLLEDAAEDFRLLAQEQGRAVEVDAASAPVLGDAKLLRQALYGLLANSLRHGRGAIRARLRERPSGFSLLIVNAVEPGSADAPGLGLGLRVVDALVGLHDGARLRCSRRGGLYAARLVFRVSPRP